jgi:hypothetical protein
VTPPANGEEELEKRLGAALLAGRSSISIDNIKAPLESALLCHALTQSLINIRLLGFSREVEVPANTTFHCNGNNLTLVGDLVRRALLCSMDAGCERPELRRFSVNAEDMARDNRARLVVAALTILRAWRLARERGERMGLEPFGSFEDWSARVREALVWLDCADPCETVEKVRANDPEGDTLRIGVTQWEAILGLNAKHTAQEIINQAMNATDFSVALFNVAAHRSGKTISAERLGWWLKKNEGRIVNKRRLLRDGELRGGSLWKLTEAK